MKFQFFTVEAASPPTPKNYSPIRMWMVALLVVLLSKLKTSRALLLHFNDNYKLKDLPLGSAGLFL